MPRSAMRPAEGDASDCILVVGVSRSKMAVAFLSVALLSLFLTFHILYDSAVYSLHAVSAVEGRTVELVSQVRVPTFVTELHVANVFKDRTAAMYAGFMAGTRDAASPFLQLQGSLPAHESPSPPGHHNRRTQVRHEGIAGDALLAPADTEGGWRGPLLRP